MSVIVTAALKVILGIVLLVTIPKIYDFISGKLLKALKKIVKVKVINKILSIINYVILLVINGLLLGYVVINIVKLIMIIF